MTINKYGNYLTITTQQLRVVTPVPVQSLTEFKSVCIFTVKGRYIEGTRFYMLEHNPNSYEFNVGVILQHWEQSNGSILISKNKADPVTAKSLVGNYINKGDIIKILRDANYPPSDEILIEFVILCPLVQDE